MYVSLRDVAGGGSNGSAYQAVEVLGAEGSERTRP